MSREEIKQILREQGKRISELELRLAQHRPLEIPPISLQPPRIPHQAGIPLVILGIILLFVIIRFFMCFWQAVLSVLGVSGLLSFLGFIAGYLINSNKAGKVLAVIIGILSTIFLSHMLSQGVVGNFIFEDAYILQSSWESFYKTSAFSSFFLISINIMIAVVKRKVIKK